MILTEDPRPPHSMRSRCGVRYGFDVLDNIDDGCGSSLRSSKEHPDGFVPDNLKNSKTAPAPLSPLPENMKSSKTTPAGT